MFKLHTIGNIKIKLFMKREMLKTVMGRAAESTSECNITKYF